MSIFFCALTWPSCTRRSLCCSSCCSAPSLWDSWSDSLLTSLSEDWKQTQKWGGGVVNKKPPRDDCHVQDRVKTRLSLNMNVFLFGARPSVACERTAFPGSYAACALGDSRLPSLQKQMSPFHVSLSHGNLHQHVESCLRHRRHEHTQLRQL